MDSPSDHIIITSSSRSATASMSSSKASSASAFSSSGTSPICSLEPNSSDGSWIMARWLTTSIMPCSWSSEPIGMPTGNAGAPSFSRISRTTLAKSAPVRSILFTNATRGTPYLVACRQTVSDCGCTPATPQKTATAPSNTRMERSTSAVKSTCPGVSMMFTRCSMFGQSFTPPSSSCFQKQVVAAEVMVMPRSRSCSIQSVTVLPSCTSPILWQRPV